MHPCWLSSRQFPTILALLERPCEPRLWSQLLWLLHPQHWEDQEDVFLCPVCLHRCLTGTSRGTPNYVTFLTLLSSFLPEEWTEITEEKCLYEKHNWFWLILWRLEIWSSLDPPIAVGDHKGVLKTLKTKWLKMRAQDFCLDLGYMCACMFVCVFLICYSIITDSKEIVDNAECLELYHPKDIHCLFLFHYL